MRRTSLGCPVAILLLGLVGCGGSSGQPPDAGRVSGDSSTAPPPDGSIEVFPDAEAARLDTREEAGVDRQPGEADGAMLPDGAHDGGPDAPGATDGVTDGARDVGVEAKDAAADFLAGSDTKGDAIADVAAPKDGTLADAAGEASGRCGTVGEACCSNLDGATGCEGDLVCLNGVSCSCAKQVFGRYILRTDGMLLYQPDSPTSAPSSVLDRKTGLPLDGVSAVMDGAAHGCALLGKSKTVWCWTTTGSGLGNSSGQLGNGTMDVVVGTLLATQVLVADGQPLVDVVSLSFPAGYSAAATCAGTEDGKLHCWGDLTWLTNGGTKLAKPLATVVTTDGTTPFTDTIQTAIEASFACSVVKGANANEVWCWGSNQYGQLGNGNTTAQQYPVKVRGLTNPTKVIAFGLDPSFGGLAGTACAIDDSGVRCWGSNGSGQLGTGSTKSSEPKPGLVVAEDGTPLAGIADIAGSISINSYAGLACARTDAGAVLCWGYGFKPYATSYRADNVVSLGSLLYGRVRVLTADGAYRVNADSSPVTCGKVY